MKILYVEDNPANLYLVKRIAKSGQHEVINYIDGEEALKDFEKIQADLVLLDIQLAGEMSGLDVVRELRKRQYKTYVVAVTAYAMVGDRERCLAAGFDDYMAKPLPIQRLMELFNNPISDAQSHRTDEVHAVTDELLNDDDVVAQILANPVKRVNEITQEIETLIEDDEDNNEEIAKENINPTSAIVSAADLGNREPSEDVTDDVSPMAKEVVSKQDNLDKDRDVDPDEVAKSPNKLSAEK